MSDTVLDFKPETAQTLVEEVENRSHQKITSCYQCRRCAAGCPVAEETGYVTPDRLIRMILLGDRDKALSNPLVWKCVSCFTCGTRCPNEIQTARIVDTLKKMAKEEHRPALAPKVSAFHDSFCASAKHMGRVNEMEFMGMYELKNTLRDLLGFKFKSLYDEMLAQGKLGLAMTGKGRMHFGLQKIKDRKELKRLYKKAKEKKRELEKSAPDEV
jgi:heterodisulfide reductase subunit C